ncbi:energy transducer TonB [Phocaeicola plebeius]|uniref:energy transducer TonB n=1 Tax=Phocaeicola plebeius TaxID=310297 RepID=UPI0035CA90EF
MLRSTNPALDEEALRIVSLMPKWKPGRQSGKPEKVRYAIPVTFERAAKVP